MSEWKNKLESLEGLRSEPLDKNQAWNKLYTRLDDSPRRKYRWITWAVAASLVIAFLLLKFVNKNDIILNGDEISVKPNQPTPEIVDERKLINPVMQKIPESTGLNRPPQVAKKKPGSLPSGTRPVEEKIIVVANEDTARNEQVLVKVESGQVAPAEIQTTPAKKKLRVVHINELGQEIKEDVMMAQRQRSGSIYLMIGNNSNTLSGEPLSVRTGAGNSRIFFNPTN